MHIVACLECGFCTIPTGGDSRITFGTCSTGAKFIIKSALYVFIKITKKFISVRIKNITLNRTESTAKAAKKFLRNTYNSLSVVNIPHLCMKSSEETRDDI